MMLDHPDGCAHAVPQKGARAASLWRGPEQYIKSFEPCHGTCSVEEAFISGRAQRLTLPHLICTLLSGHPCAMDDFGQAKIAYFTCNADKPMGLELLPPVSRALLFGQSEAAYRTLSARRNGLLCCFQGSKYCAGHDSMAGHKDHAWPISMLINHTC